MQDNDNNPPNHKDQSGYASFRKDAESPKGKQKKKLIGRNGAERDIRKYHLKDDEKEELIRKAEEEGRIPNAYAKRTSIYWGQVEALIQLGPDQWHHFGDVKTMLRSILLQHNKNIAVKDEDGKPVYDGKQKRTTQVDHWTHFSNGDESSQSVDGKIQTNFRVLQRTNLETDSHPFGLKLAQLGMCIDIEYQMPDGITDPDLAIPYYRLRTGIADENAVDPICKKPAKKRGRKKKEEQVIEPIEEASSLTHEAAEAVDDLSEAVEDGNEDAAITALHDAEQAVEQAQETLEEVEGIIEDQTDTDEDGNPLPGDAIHNDFEEEENIDLNEIEQIESMVYEDD